MLDKFDSILDICIDRINRGDRIEDCLADYPKYAEELEPLLRSMLSTKDAFSFVPSASAKQESWQRFSTALRQSEQRQEKNRLPFPRILGGARSWAAASAVVILIGIAVASYIGVTQLSSPGVILSHPDPEGNLAFFISDSSNAIADFERLELKVSKVSLQKQGGEWVEFIPETGQVDLAMLQGELAQQVWKGNVPHSQYSSAVLYVSHASGILKSTGESVDIELPDKKLHLEMPFDISSGSVTEFVYDISVKAPDSGKYTLQPVVEESGPGKSLQKVDDKEKDSGAGNDKDLDQDNKQDDKKNNSKVNSLDKGSGQGQGQAAVYIQDQDYGPGKDKDKSDSLSKDDGSDKDKGLGEGDGSGKDKGLGEGDEPDKDKDKSESLSKSDGSDKDNGLGEGDGLDKDKDKSESLSKDDGSDKDKDKSDSLSKDNGSDKDKDKSDSLSKDDGSEKDKGLDQGGEKDQVKDEVEDNGQAKDKSSDKEK